MENQIQIFEHEHFGKVRVVMIDNDPWFVAVDVCRVLALGNVSQALRRLNDKEKSLANIPARGIISIDTQGGEQNMLTINEPGLYRLIFASRKKEAVDFQDWVYHEVLPSIRKTGSYSLVDKPAAVVKPEPALIVPETIYRVYAFLMENELVKIGYTKRFCSRISEIKRMTGLPIVDIYFSPFMDCEDAHLVERCCKEIFSSRHMKGEFFSVKFAEACTAINRFVKLAAVKPLATKHHIAAAKLIADKNST